MRPRALLLALALAVPASAAAQNGAAGFDLSSLHIPAGFLDLSDLVIDGTPGAGLTAIARTTLGSAQADVLISSAPGANGRRNVTLAVRPIDWSLTQAIPALSNPVLDNIRLSHVTLVITDQDLRVSSAEMSDDQYDFYHAVYGTDDFTLVLHPGINLIAAIPTEGLPEDSPLRRVMDALGIEHGTVLLQGGLGKSLDLLRGGGSADAIRDLYLRAELPPMRPPGSPGWFRSGQLALEITGQPSLRLVGEMDVTIDDADLQFFLAAMLARSGVSLSGGMTAERPWVSPFGVSWLTLKRVVLEIGITSTGSVELGFAGAAVIGEKDIDVAVALALSPAGVPTNFLMHGQSEAGVGISDLVRLQAGMAAAREAAAGPAPGGTDSSSATTLIPLAALPDIEVRSLELQFAPRPDPVLGIERGFKLKGRLWLPTGPGGELTDFAGVDANVSDEGVWVRGDIGAFRIGPLAFDDAKLDLTATRQDQHLLVHGQVQLGASRQLLDLSITRQALSFRSETELFGLFHATLSAQAAFQLRNPSFAVDGVVSNDFGEYVQPILREGVLRFATGGRAVVTGAENAAEAAQRALAVGEATVAQLRTALETQRRNAEAAWGLARDRAAATLARVNAAAASRDAARSLWEGTPARRPALRAARHAEFLRLAAVYAARVTGYLAAQVSANGLRAILDAIPPVDRNALLLAADAAAAALRRQLEQAEQNLRNLATRYDQVIAALRSGTDPLAVQYAAFHADLAIVQGGGSMSWTVRGIFVGQPFELHRQLDFGSPAQAAAALLGGLISG